MSRFHLLALLLGVLLVAAPFTRNSAFAEEEYEDDDEEGEKDDVVVLTEKNFDSIVSKSKFALVEFYAPWCGHCKTLAPQYSTAATALKKYDSSIVIAKVDATVESALGSKFGIKGYPTLKWFIDGELASDYDGGRDSEGIINWIKKKTGPFATTIDSADKIAELEKENPFFVVGYFEAFEGADYETFKGVATKIEDVVFFQTTDAAVAKAAGLDKFGFAAVKNFAGEERAVAVFSGDVKADALSAFFNSEKMPLTIEFNSGNSNKIFKSGIDKQVIFWASPADLSADSAVFQALVATAKTFKGKVVFVTSNKDSNDADPITKFFGLAGEAGPVALGFFMEKNTKYRFKGEFNEKELSAFTQSVLDGTAEAEYKSADIPAKPLDEGVTVIVGKNFNDIVMDPTKDVLLEVYAPWCGHCKSLAPTWVKLAAHFKDVDSVVIAKMDGTENEHPSAEAKGFPTLLFYPADKNKTPQVYNGGRDLDSLVKYIMDKAKSKFEIPAASEEEEEEKESKDEL